MRPVMMIVSLLAAVLVTTVFTVGTASAQSRDAAAEERVRSLLREPTVPATLPQVEEEIRELLAAGASPDAPDPYGRTAVHYAAGRDSHAFSGTDRLLRLVLAAGGSCCAGDAVGDTPLHYAAAEGIDGLNDEQVVLATVRILLRYDADPNAANGLGYTPLHFAARAATAFRASLVRALLDAGGDRDRAADDGNTPLHLAAGDTVKLASGHGHDNFSSSELTQPGMRNPQGLEVLRVLLDGPASVNARNGAGMTPLLVVLHEGAIATTAAAVTPLAVEALLDAGADPNVVRGDGLTPLHVVLAWPDLLSRRASRLEDDAVPLVEALLDAGADADRPNPDGDTPLHAAVRMGWGTGMVDVLLAAGADPCIRNTRERYFPDQLARQLGAGEVERALGLAGGFQLACEERELDPDARKRVQACLQEQGFDPGAPDGVFGPRTRAAIQAWQEAQGGFGQDSPGALSADSAARLLEACEEKPAEAGEPDQAAQDGASGPEPRCTGQPGPACWMETANQPGCHVWNPNPAADETVTWSGPCVDGKASGRGEVVWRFRENGQAKTSGGTGELRGGDTYHGHWIEFYSDGEVWEGLLVNDQLHGHWVKRGEGGTVWNCWQDGERVDKGACEAPAEGRMQATGPVTLRSGPGDEYEETGRLAADDAVDVTGRAGEWVRVETRNGRGGLVPASAVAEPAGPAPGETFRDCDACPEMVVVPAGSFMMGSPDYDYLGPVHRVTIPAPFAVGKYEVTFAEWDACVAGGGCEGFRPDDVWGRGDRPVINVSWDDGQAYVRWLSREAGEQYRLLSEPEWEYAARAGSQTLYAWGDEIGRDRANCDGCGSRWEDESTAPVGSFAPNAFGLHDMHGNVWEWVEDCVNNSYAGAPSDGTAWVSGNCEYRVLRGGSWGSDPRILRSAYRGWNSTGNRYNYLGFRVARTLAP